MSSTTLEIFFILLLILANGVLSMAEIALVSSRKARLEQRAGDGDSGAQTALKLTENPNRFLSTVQIGISLVGILSGALGGATLEQDLANLLVGVPALAPYRNAIALVAVVLVITYFSLVLGELVPKRIALNNPEGIAARMAGLMRFLGILTGPVVRILSVSTDLGLRLLRIRPSTEPPVTEEEIRFLLEEGAQEGVIEEVEQDMVEGVFRLGERRVDALMTPRTEIAWLDLDEPLEENLKIIRESPHSRFPVGQESLDNVIGILPAKDLLVQQLSGKPVDLRSLLQPPLYVPDSMPALEVLEMFKRSGVPLALIIDEYGGLQGMVSLYDVLEAIVGEFKTLGTPFEPQAVQREDGSWLFDGMLQIDEFKEILDIDNLPEEERAGYSTVGGFMMSQLGNIPDAGDHFHWGKWRFEVVDMDGRRVDKVLVSPASENVDGARV